MSDKAIQIAEAIRKITDFRPEIGFILGSGWGKAAENLREKQTIPYADLPGMPLCGVAGHAGNFLFGVLGGRRVVIVQGRIHLYEGRSIEDVLLPVRILDALGVRDLLLTNAAGGADPSFSPGDLMVVRKQNNAEIGEVVIARIDGEEATAKILAMSESGFYLKPANDAMDESGNRIYKDIHPQHGWEIMGVVDNVIHRPDKELKFA